MKTELFMNTVLRPIVNFTKFYQTYRVNSKKVSQVKYRIVSSLEEFKKTNLIQLSFNDNPGDLLAPVSIEKIKNTPDIIAGMHPIDINTINDIYYLSKDNIVEIRIEKDAITAIHADGTSIRYNIDEDIDPSSIKSTRIAYQVGYMRAEKLIRDSYSSILNTTDSYQIVADNITTLEIKEVASDNHFLRNPLDILYSSDYKKFSREDVCRIGYICGQISKPRD